MLVVLDAGPVESRNGRPDVHARTPPPVAVVLSIPMWRVAALCGCAGERAVTVGEEG